MHLIQERTVTRSLLLVKSRSGLLTNSCRLVWFRLTAFCMFFGNFLEEASGKIAYVCRKKFVFFASQLNAVKRLKTFVKKLI
jgi:hypothetical protein